MNIFTEWFESGSLNAEFQVEYFKYYVSYGNSMLAYSFFFLLNESSIDYCIIKYKQKIPLSCCRWNFFFSRDSSNSCCCCSESWTILLVPCLSILSPLDKKSVLPLFFTLQHLIAQSRIHFVYFFAKLSW